MHAVSGLLPWRSLQRLRLSSFWPGRSLAVPACPTTICPPACALHVDKIGFLSPAQPLPFQVSCRCNPLRSAQDGRARIAVGSVVPRSEASVALFVQSCFVLVCLLQFVWAYRLYRLGLARRYRVLFVYLLATGLFSLGAMLFKPFAISTLLMVFYGKYWVTTILLGWILLFALILEAATRMIEGYAGLERLGQIVTYIVMAASGVLMVAMTVLDVSVATWQHHWLAHERAVYASLTGTCFVLFMMAKTFRLPVTRNLKIIFGSLGTLFALKACFVLLTSLKVAMDPRVIQPVMAILTVAVTAGGAFLFSGRDEKAPVLVPDTGASPQRAGNALQDINRILVRILRSKSPAPSSPRAPFPPRSTALTR